jgi:hypothetical protein
MKTINALDRLSVEDSTGRTTVFAAANAPSRIRRRDLSLGEAIPLWFAMLSPLIGLIIGFLGAWLFSSLTT